MTKNNTFFKILFAIEVALLPMVIFAQLFLPNWGVSLFVAAVLIAKIWLDLFNDKTLLSEIIIAIGNCLVFSVVLIMFMATKQINIALSVVTLVFVVLASIFKVVLHSKPISETIEAVDYCCTLFQCLALIGLIIIKMLAIISTIGLISVILTSAVSIGYKVFYIFKYMGVANKIKNLFRRR